MARMVTAAWVIMLAATGCADGTQAPTTEELLELSRSLDAWAAQPPATSKAGIDQPPVHEMIGGLEAKLAANPDDAQGFSLLAQSYAFTGRIDDARVAADRAIALGVPAEEMQAKIVHAHSGIMK